MEEYTIQMKQATINNAKVFLERITLTPKEVPAYLDIINALEQAEKIQEKEGD
jgi:hypothetical protein